MTGCTTDSTATFREGAGALIAIAAMAVLTTAEASAQFTRPVPVPLSDAQEVLVAAAEFMLVQTDSAEYKGQPTSRHLLRGRAGTVMVSVIVSTIDDGRDPADAAGLAATIASALQRQGVSAQPSQSEIVNRMCPLTVLSPGHSQRACTFPSPLALLLSLKYPHRQGNRLYVAVSTFTDERRPDGGHIRSNLSVGLERSAGKWQVVDVRRLVLW